MVCCVCQLVSSTQTISSLIYRLVLHKSTTDQSFSLPKLLLCDESLILSSDYAVRGLLTSYEGISRVTTRFAQYPSVELAGNGPSG
jgi:hypothetical protein